MINGKLIKRKENEKRKWKKKRKNAKKNFARHRDGSTEGNQTYENYNAYIYFVQTFNIYDMYVLWCTYAMTYHASWIHAPWVHASWIHSSWIQLFPFLFVFVSVIKPCPLLPTAVPISIAIVFHILKFLHLVISTA